MMSKAVLISINPKWCELIASGKKTVEVRETRPKLETPFKCYIYCTKGSNDLIKGDMATTINYVAKNSGKVIGEFVCDGITGLIAPDEVQTAYNATRQTCISEEEIKEYAKAGRLFYWHISDLVIYDKPKEPGDFKVEVTNKIWSFTKQLERPPQSWCYVENLEV